MDFDISHLLDQWDYQPGQVVVRRFKARDGKEKLQLRVDLGLLQMNAEGRPDGKRPFGHPSLFEYYQARLYKHVGAHEGSDEGWTLKAEDCAKLQMEAIQYHHRYICLLQLEDYPAVIRDAERNLAVFEFVGKHAEAEELAWALRQFQPQLLMILARARGSQALRAALVKRAIVSTRKPWSRLALAMLDKYFREIAEAEIYLAGEPARRVHRLLQRSPVIGRARHRHEDEPHRQQNLVELVAAIEPPVEEALDRDAGNRRRQRRGGERQRERHPEPVHQAGHHIAAEHREDAVRQVDKAHHPHRHRQPDRDQVEHHRKRDAVEADADDRGKGVAHGEGLPGG